MPRPQTLVAPETSEQVISKKRISAPDALNEAYHYAKPSSFSRGLRLDIKGITILLISGTASIDDQGRSIHQVDFRAQTKRTSRTSRSCSKPKAPRGKTSSAPPAICATSSVTTRPSTKNERNSLRNRNWTPCPPRPASRRFCVARNCWSRWKQWQSSILIAAKTERKSRPRRSEGSGCWIVVSE